VKNHPLLDQAGNRGVSPQTGRTPIRGSLQIKYPNLDCILVINRLLMLFGYENRGFVDRLLVNTS